MPVTNATKGRGQFRSLFRKTGFMNIPLDVSYKNAQQMPVWKGSSLYVDLAMVLASAGSSVVDIQVVIRQELSQMPAHYAKAELADQGIAKFKDRKSL